MIDRLLWVYKKRFRSLARGVRGVDAGGDLTKVKFKVGRLDKITAKLIREGKITTLVVLSGDYVVQHMSKILEDA